MTSQKPACALRRGLTLVELLAILLFLALLVIVVIPNLAGSRPARRTQCLANVKFIAQACLLYSEANQGYLPSGAIESTEPINTAVGQYRGWSDLDRLPEDSGPKYASPTRPYHRLLLGGKRAPLQPKQLICPSATKLGHEPRGVNPYPSVTQENLADFPPGTQIGSPGQYYDFDGLKTEKGRLTRGISASEMVEFSYSFQMTRRFGGRGVELTNSCDPRMVLVADRSPFSNYVVPQGTGPNSFARYEYRADNAAGYRLPGTLNDGTADWTVSLKVAAKSNNSRNHKQDGQNVGFLDGHAKWYNTSLAGADDDCIWTISPSSGAA